LPTTDCAEDAKAPMHIVHMDLCGPRTHSRPETARAVSRTGSCARGASALWHPLHSQWVRSSLEKATCNAVPAMHGSQGSAVHAAKRPAGTSTMYTHPPRDSSGSGPHRCMCARCAKGEQRCTGGGWQGGGGAPGFAQPQACPTLKVPNAPQFPPLHVPHSVGPTLPTPAAQAVPQAQRTMRRTTPDLCYPVPTLPTKAPAHHVPHGASRQAARRHADAVHAAAQQRPDGERARRALRVLRSAAALASAPVAGGAWPHPPHVLHKKQTASQQ